MNKENILSHDNRPDLKQYVCISPYKELNFDFKRNKYITQLTITNILTRNVSFKIKTNSPKHYLVNPSGGTIPAKEQITVKIMMISQDQLKERCNDRFLVQAFPSDKVLLEKNNLHPGIAQACAITKDATQKVKLKVHFVCKERSKDDLDSSNSSYSPLKKYRPPLREIVQTQTPSTVESMKYNPDFSQLDTLHYIPRRSRLTLSPEEDEKIEYKIKTKEYISEFSGIYETPHNKSKYIGGATLTTITPGFKNNHSNNVMTSLDHSCIKQDLYTERTCEVDEAKEKSTLDFSNEDCMFRYRIIKLEKKNQHQKKLLAEMTSERDNYVEELNKLKFIYPERLSECVEKCKAKRKCITFELWQLMLISVVFLIVGSTVFS